MSATDSNVARTMKGVERSLTGVETASKSATLQTGRLGNQFANLAGQIAHTHPIVGNLAGVLSTFAVGSLASAGILGGLAALAVLYDKITESSRKASEQADKLRKSLVDQARAIQAATLAGRQNLELQQELDLIAVKRQSGIGISSVLQSILTGKPTLADADMAALSKKTADAQTAYEQAGKNTFEAWKQANEPIKETSKHLDKVTAKLKDLSFTFEQLRATSEEFWGPMNRFNAAFALPNLVEDMTPGAVDISDSVKIANDQAKKINDEAARHAQMIHDAIWGSAAALANQVVGALNIGGGGKGSNLGGAIGGTAGFAAGFVIGGPAGGAIGSLLGNIGGSLIGGLFDHKKAIETNTNAVRQNTAALLLNSPSGYKTASGRFDATEVKEFRRGLQRYATRGGAPILVTP